MNKIARATPVRSVLTPLTVTILASYRCNAACKNCCFDSNPTIRERLSLDEILHFIDEAAALGTVEMVVFSGGECFLLGQDLNRAIAHATTLGLKTRCVTNGYWAKSMAHGRRRLKDLKEVGLQELNISTGDFHQAFVAQDCVVNAACLGVELGFNNTLVVVEIQRMRRITGAEFAALPRVAGLLAQAQEGGAPFRVIESPWMPMSRETPVDHDPERLLNRSNLHLKGGCDSVLTTLVLTPSGQVGFCCGLSREKIPELNGDWRKGDLAGMLNEVGSDFIKIWLLIDGPERMLAWAASIEPRIDWENRYSHHCHACMGIFTDPLVRQTIRMHYRERVEDVLLRYSILLRRQEAALGAVYG